MKTRIAVILLAVALSPGKSLDLHAQPGWAPTPSQDNTELIKQADELYIELSHTLLYETWAVRGRLMIARSEFVGEVDPAEAVWSSSDPTVATFDVERKRFVAHEAGAATISATYGGQTAAVDVTVLAPVLPPVYESIPPYLSAPPEDAVHEVPVVVIRYLPTENGVDLDVTKASDFWWLNEITLEDMKARIDLMDIHTKYMLEEGSRFRGYKTLRGETAEMPPPSIGYKVIEYITVYEPTPPGLIIRWEAGHPIYDVDVDQVFERFGIESYVNDLGVREIWFWSTPLSPSFPIYKQDPSMFDPRDFRSMWESNMASPTTGDISNSNRAINDLPIYNHTYVVYGSNFRRTQAESVHNHGHQIEVMLKHANWKQDGNDWLFNQAFIGTSPHGLPLLGRAGWTHMPPNTIRNYDYTNPALVLSDIEDWTPGNTGEKTWVNVDTWGTMPYDWPAQEPAEQNIESQWYIYWMQNFPGHQNVIQHGDTYMTNWWYLIARWDDAMQSDLGLHALEPGLPVELTAFEGIHTDTCITLSWKTASELNNAGFVIERALDLEDFVAVGFVEGAGTTTEETDYVWADASYPSTAKQVYYRLKQIDFDGTFVYSEALTVDIPPPGAYHLEGNYPNPFNPTTVIRYRLPVRAEITLRVYDLLGREITTLVDGLQEAGLHEAVFDAGSLAGGVYLYQLETPRGRFASRMVLAK